MLSGRGQVDGGGQGAAPGGANSWSRRLEFWEQRVLREVK